MQDPGGLVPPHLQASPSVRVSTQQALDDSPAACAESLRQRPAAARLDVEEGGRKVVGLGGVL